MVGPSLGAVRTLQMCCVEFEDLFIYKVLTSYPGLMELARLLNLFGTEIMFLELDNSDRPLVMAREVRGLHASTVVIAFVRDRCEPGVRQEALAAGIAEILEPPFSPVALQAAVVRALQARCPGVANNVVAFLPGKPGSGASTISCNVAGVLAQSLGQYALLLDGDMNSGVVSTLLGLDPIHTVVDALESSHELNDSMWRYRTGKAHGFDVLPMPKNRRVGMFPQWNYQRVLNFVRERYDLVLVDLPDVLNHSNEADLPPIISTS
jgi:Flp pilus assembly CpaE family ATPase